MKSLREQYTDALRDCIMARDNYEHARRRATDLRDRIEWHRTHGDAPAYHPGGGHPPVLLQPSEASLRAAEGWPFGRARHGHDPSVSHADWQRWWDAGVEADRLARMLTSGQRIECVVRYTKGHEHRVRLESTDVAQLECPGEGVQRTGD